MKAHYQFLILIAACCLLSSRTLAETDGVPTNLVLAEEKNLESLEAKGHRHQFHGANCLGSTEIPGTCEDCPDLFARSLWANYCAEKRPKTLHRSRFSHNHCRNCLPRWRSGGFSGHSSCSGCASTGCSGCSDCHTNGTSHVNDPQTATEPQTVTDLSTTDENAPIPPELDSLLPMDNVDDSVQSELPAEDAPAEVDVPPNPTPLLDAEVNEAVTPETNDDLLDDRSAKRLFRRWKFPTRFGG